MTQKFPRMTATIVEVVDGFTVTIWFRHAAGLGNAALLTDEPVGSIEEARSIIRRHAQDRHVGSEDIDEDIEMHDFLPPEESRH
jgi:hypothetical protein